MSLGGIKSLIKAAQYIEQQEQLKLSPQSLGGGGGVAISFGGQHFINGNGYSSSKSIANNNNSASQLNRNNTPAAAAATTTPTTTTTPANVNGHNGLSNGIAAAAAAASAVGLSNGQSSPRSQLVVTHDYEYVSNAGSAAGVSVTGSNGQLEATGRSSEGRSIVSGEFSTLREA